MATSRSKTAKAEERRISQIGEFKNRVGGLIELPSGLFIKWRNPGGLRAFMGTGKIPNSLLVVVEEGLKGGKGVDKKMAADMMRQVQDDPEMIKELTSLYDHIAMQCFVEPRLHPVPTLDDLERWNENHLDDIKAHPEELRRDDMLYVDEVPDDDKAFLFQLISGGTRDLETFRKQHEESLELVAAESISGSDAVGDTGADEG